jgi:hypothetical protein
VPGLYFDAIHFPSGSKPSRQSSICPPFIH